VHLRSITLQGFKTFAQRTELLFDAGVTAVVGPNGSGKSNTVDSFKWVLGETRAKDLRGAKMEEVIYGGGARRPRASSAEVTVVIDNSDRRLPVDYEEVSIKRRIDRKGQSDYFLNGSRVRRRDLMELLASTGLTTDSYAIVDQRDIEHIISCTPEQRRLLIEEAAQVRGVKAKRTEAVQQLKELAGNLIRLEDLRQEIEPRLDVIRAQAEAAREADEARRRLDLLKGSIAWEEWREAREAHRKAARQVESLEKRLEEAGGAAEVAEADYKRCKDDLEAAQNRRLSRQQAIGAARLEVSNAEHALAMAGERSRSQAALAAAARTEEEELRGRLEAAVTRREQLAEQVAAARQELERVPASPPPPPAGDANQARDAARLAERAARDLHAAESALAAARTRCQLLADQVAKLEAQVGPAEKALAEAERALAAAAEEARKAADASSQLGRLKGELKGLEALRPTPRGQLKRVGDVIIARPGYEAALAAVLGSLVDAWAAPDEERARVEAARTKNQTTVLYPMPGSEVERGSLAEYVRCLPGYEDLAARLLGKMVIGRDVTTEGVYRAPGIVRAGKDPRTEIAARRHELNERIAELEPAATLAGSTADASRRAQARVNELKSVVGQRRRLEDLGRQLEAARSQESAEADRIPGLERAASEAGSRARELAKAIDDHQKLLAEHRGECQRLDMERARWRERVGDLRRQLDTATRDEDGIQKGLVARAGRAAQASAQAAEAEQRIPALTEALESARARLAEAERESPEEEAELAEAARRLVSVEEARVEARLKISNLSGTLELQRREMATTNARMEELRTRMPEGMAPEEVPGGKAREREMRQLERRLIEIGPTNPLAEQECGELEERYSNLLRQLEDITAARADLEQLIGKLREEEETRYEAVLGAVAANFQEHYAELTGGGRCTLQEVSGDDGPHSGVEILVQPPRKRMQRVSLLSSGERSLTALALVIALQAVNPAPFTIFDEVDAALDDANVGRFGEMLQKLGQERQFMVITHNHATMACCSAMYGVHLDESGSSHLVSVRLKDIAPADRHQVEAVATA
jgi:chromosome segregation protein